MEAVYVLWLRQVKRYFRSKSRIVGALGQPILFLIALGYGLGSVFKQAGGGNYLHFLVPGVIAQSILFTSMFSGMEVIWDKQFGFLKETMVAPVSRFAVMFGRTLGGATVAAVQGLIVLGLSYALGFRVYNWNLVPLAIVAMLLMALLFTSLGTAVASLVDDFQGFQLIMNFLAMPMFFLSGALFPLNQAPRWLRFIANINPLSYGTDAIRGLLINVAHYSLVTDFAFLIVAAAVLLGTGSLLFKRIQV